MNVQMLIHVLGTFKRRVHVMADENTGVMADESVKESSDICSGKHFNVGSSNVEQGTRSLLITNKGSIKIMVWRI